MYWYVQHLCNLPDLAEWTGADKTRLRTVAMIVLMVSSIGGNFIAAGVAKLVGYRRGIALMFLCYFVSVFFAYSVPYSYAALFGWFIPLGASAGVFGLFTMYLPPLFPVLLRTTGAGFCYNIGRIAAGVGIVLFGMFVHLGDCRPALFYSGFLFLPAAALAMFLPELGDKDVVA
jgi:MFS family permease